MSDACRPQLAHRTPPTGWLDRCACLQSSSEGAAGGEACHGSTAGWLPLGAGPLATDAQLMAKFKLESGKNWGQRKTAESLFCSPRGRQTIWRNWMVNYRPRRALLQSKEGASCPRLESKSWWGSLIKMLRGGIPRKVMRRSWRGWDLRLTPGAEPRQAPGNLKFLCPWNVHSAHCFRIGSLALMYLWESEVLSLSGQGIC